MEESIKQYLLCRIRNEWQSLPSDQKPWGIWILQYSPLASDVRKISHSGLAVESWFLDEDGIRQKSVWEFKRYMVVQGEQPWCKKRDIEQSVSFTSRRHEIGIAAFAKYAGSSDVYLEVIWGGLNGKGLRINLDEDGELIEDKMLWVS